jgi:hypothetical protein
MAFPAGWIETVGRRQAGRPRRVENCFDAPRSRDAVSGLSCQIGFSASRTAGVSMFSTGMCMRDLP